MVIPRDFHVLDLPRANLARRLNPLIAFLVAIPHLHKRLMRTKPVQESLRGGARCFQGGATVELGYRIDLLMSI